MKGLDMLGKMFRNRKDEPKYLSRDDQKRIRKKINVNKICDLCLYDYDRQTVDGRMLCELCFKEENTKDE